MAEQKLTSIEIGRAALRIAVTENRTEEQRVKEQLAANGIRSTAVDFGGEFMPSIVKIVERAVVAAQRQGIVTETHVGAGAVWSVPWWRRSVRALLRKRMSARARLPVLPMRRWSSLLPRRPALTWAAKLALPAAASIYALPFTWRWAC